MWLALVHQEIGVSWLQVVIDGFALALALPYERRRLTSQPPPRRFYGRFIENPARVKRWRGSHAFCYGASPGRDNPSEPHMKSLGYSVRLIPRSDARHPYAAEKGLRREQAAGTASSQATQWSPRLDCLTEVSAKPLPKLPNPSLPRKPRNLRYTKAPVGFHCQGLLRSDCRSPSYGRLGDLVVCCLA
jgi:hypothetical protein